MTAHLAIDPGTVGAAALVDAPALVGWAAWRRSRRRSDPFDVCASTVRRTWRAPTLPHAIRAALCHLPADVEAHETTAVEGIRPHGARRGFVLLAESAGVAVAVLDAMLGPDVLRPLPSEWRPAALGIPGATPAPEADAYALHLVGWGPDPDGIRKARGRYPAGRIEGGRPAPEWARVHVADAAAMALWLAGVA